MGESNWYKEAIIYEVHVKCFYDASNDGVGDFSGLSQKLDYLQDLGITAIWLLPFYPSPLKDDGYDISDYTSVHPVYGTLRDFKHFLREAHKRNIRVITELVINHTSDQHIWFQKARRASKNSKIRNFYVWSDDPDRFKDARIIFQDFESSNWSWDQEAQSYYWHRFYYHQPDLNFDLPEVHKAIFRILSFWLKMGVDGVRLDAVPYLYERDGTVCENLPETHGFLKELRKFVDEHFKDKMLLAEANQWPEEAAKYFGSGDECHMAFHFPVMPRLFMSIHLEDSLPIIEIMGQTPAIPFSCQWALFLRNHDELTLEMVTDEERDYMFRVYATDPQARLNLGIRRRLAPLLKNDRRKIELMNSLLFSLTGTPVLYYGDEIGMGDNIYLGDRNGVRTPMQWSNDRNAGFSRANPQQLYLPPIIDPEFHYETVNVEAELNNPNSLLFWTKQLISLRKKFKAFSYGTTDFLYCENRKILVFFREYQEELIMIVANLSRFPQYVELDLSKYNGFSLIEMFSGERFPKIGELPYFLTLGPFGYYWFLLQKQPKESLLEIFDREKEREYPEMIIRKPGLKIFEHKARRTLENALRHYLLRRIWFKPFASQLESVHIVDQVDLDRGGKQIHLVFLEIHLTAGAFKQILFYLTNHTGEEALKKLQEAPENVVIKFKHQKKEESIEVLFDVGMGSETSKLFLDLIENQKKVKTEKGELKGILIPKVLEPPPMLSLGSDVNYVYREEDVIVFPLEKGVIREFWQVDEGMSIDVEMRTFLLGTSFRQFLPLIGYLEYQGGEELTLALAEEISSVRREFNAKSIAQEAADRFLVRFEGIRKELPMEIFTEKASWIELSQKKIPEKISDLLAEDLEFANLLGRVTAHFHLALSQEGNDPSFAPIPFTLFYQRSVYQTLRRKVNEGISLLKRQAKKESKKEIENLSSLCQKILEKLQILPHYKFKALRTRYHGNYILEKLHYTGKEIYIANFDGDLRVPYRERRYKRSPLLDLTSLFLSLEMASEEGVRRVLSRAVLKEESVKEIDKWRDLWTRLISARILRSYLDHLPKTSFLPEDPKEIDFLIILRLLEKAFDNILSGQSETAVRTLLYWLPIYENFKLS